MSFKTGELRLAAKDVFTMERDTLDQNAAMAMICQNNSGSFNPGIDREMNLTQGYDHS